MDFKNHVEDYSDIDIDFGSLLKDDEVAKIAIEIVKETFPEYV